MNAYRDPEMDDLGDEQRWDPQVRELAHYLRSSSRAYAHIEPSVRFRQDLRRRLMREAWELAAKPPKPWYQRLLAPQPMAMAGALVGAVLIVTVAFLSLGPQQHDQINVAVVSPQNNTQLDATIRNQPIVLQFSQPMKTDSVQLDIQPATAVSRSWDEQHKVLTLTPRNGLSANTQYTVTVTSASTAQSQPVSKIKPVVFSTLPTPAPTPSTGPRPTQPPSQILNPRSITQIASGSRVHWSLDGGSLFAIGQDGVLQQISLTSGTAPKHIADGVSMAAVAPDGSIAWLSGAQVTWKSTTVNNVQPVALGFRPSGLLLASAADVETADQRRVAGFRENATAADFSASGDRVAYLGASGLHLVDLASGADTAIGPAIALGAWGPDGRHYAYVTRAGVSVANASDGSTAALVSLPGVSGLSWSGSEQQLLVSAGGALSLVNYGGGATTAHTQSTAQDGTFSAPDWAPSGGGEFSFVRDGQVWVAKLQGALPGAPPITPVTPGVSQIDLVNSFMAARQNGALGQAQAFLDTTGLSAFTGLNLVYNSDPSLARYYVLLSQPGRVVVRLVLTRGQVQTAVDETLTIQPDASNHPYIHAVSESPRLSFGSGPEVTAVTVASNAIKVQFDSDLAPLPAGAVSIRGVATQSQYDSSKRTVTLTTQASLNPNQTYDLVVTPALQDVSQRSAVQYDLQFAGPTS